MAQEASRSRVDAPRSALPRWRRTPIDWPKETLELRVRLHDLGAIEVLRVLGVLVRAHAGSELGSRVFVLSRSDDTGGSRMQIREPFSSIAEPVSRSLSPQTYISNL